MLRTTVISVRPQEHADPRGTTRCGHVLHVASVCQSCLAEPQPPHPTAATSVCTLLTLTRARQGAAPPTVLGHPAWLSLFPPGLKAFPSPSPFPTPSPSFPKATSSSLAVPHRKSTSSGLSCLRLRKSMSPSVFYFSFVFTILVN